MKVLQKASIKIIWLASVVAINISSQLVEAQETKFNHTTDKADNIVCLSTSGDW